MTTFSTQEIQELARQAGVDKPVLSVRVAGGRVELHLLGGTAVSVPALAPAEADPGDFLESLTIDRLRRLALELGLTGYSKLKKPALIALLVQEASAERLAEAAQD